MNATSTSARLGPRSVLALWLLLSSSTLLRAQQAKAPEEQPAEAFAATLDLAVPDEPAFIILGVSQENVTRPASPRALGLALLQGIDPSGNMQSGVALSTVPYLLLQGKNLALRDYQKKTFKRSLSNVQLSLATSKGSSDKDQSIRVAVCVRWTVFDQGDARMDDKLIACVGEAQKNALKGSPPLPPDPSKEDEEVWKAKLETAVENEAEPCRKVARSRNWNKSALEIGVAPTWTSPSGSSDDLESSGWGAWASLSNPLLQKGQWVLGVRYRSDEPGPDPLQVGAVVDRDVLTAGLRFRYGSPRQAFLAEGSYQRVSPEVDAGDTVYRYSVGAEVRVAEGLWLQLAAGASRGQDTGENAGFVGGQFKWAFSQKPASPILLRSAG